MTEPVTTPLFTGFVFSTLLIRLAVLLLKKKRELLYRLLSLSQLMLAAAASLYLAEALWTLWQSPAGSGEWESFAAPNRLTGPYWYIYWGQLAVKGFFPLILWFKAIRQTPRVSLCFALVLLPALFPERTILALVSLHRDFLPSSWTMYFPAWPGILVYTAVYLLVLAALFLILRQRKTG